jgi:hypothetical protein
MKTLPKEIYKATNQAAHRLAIEHESHVRNLLLKHLTVLVESGAEICQLNEALMRFEVQSRRPSKEAF